MYVSMNPKGETGKVIHISQNDTNREVEFIPFDQNGLTQLTDEQRTAKINSIKGNTVSFNQLVQNGNFVDTSGWILTGTLSASNNVITIAPASFTNSVAMQGNSIITVTGHKYYIRLECKYNNKLPNINPFIGVGGAYGVISSVSQLNTWTKIAGIYTVETGSTGTVNFYIRAQGWSSGDTVDARNFMLFDLTLMGIDNLTTTTEVEQWLSTHIGDLPYYGYTQGSLISFNGTGLKTENADQTESNTLSLPTLTYFPTGMKSTGGVYDELTPSKAITRIGSRAYQSGDESDPSVITDGTTTYYPLPTPTETDITPSLDLTYPIENGGTEQILPVNTSTPTTSPIKANITYPDRTEDTEFLYKQTSFEWICKSWAFVCKNITQALSVVGNALKGTIPGTMTSESGKFPLKVKMTDNDGVCFSEKIDLFVERKP